MIHYDPASVKSLARGRWAEILSAVAGIPPEILDGDHHPCPKCGGADRFRFSNRDGDGSIICNNCARRQCGDGLASVQWALQCDFPTALRLVCDYLGVVPESNGKPQKHRASRRQPAAAAAVGPKKAAADPAEHLEFRPWSDQLVAVFCLRKPPITREGILAAGGRLATYRKRFTVIALPVCGADLNHDNPVGHVLYNVTGGTLPAYRKGDGDGGKWTCTQVKVKTLPGTQRGLVGSFGGPAPSGPGVPGGIDYKTEGTTDLLSLLSQGLRPGERAYCNAFGCGEDPTKTPWLGDHVAGRHVITIHDADVPGQEGAIGAPGRPGWASWLARTAVSSRNVKLPYPVADNHGKDLRDYFNEGHSRADFDHLVESAEIASPVPEKPKRPEVVLGMNERDVADEVLSHVAELGWRPGEDPSRRVFQQRGQLVEIVRALPDTVCGGVEVTVGTPLIRPVPRSTFRERVTEAVDLGVFEGEGEEFVRRRPPDWLINASLDRGYYDAAVRRITGVVTTPTLRPDGSLLQTAGYDASTGLLYEPDGEFPPIADTPTRQEAIDAANRLLEIVADFPFAGPAHRSVWLSLVLTFIARPAINGCTPLFAIDANCPAAGKGLLQDCAAIPAYGRELPRKTWSDKDAEISKTVTSVLLHNLVAMSFDNIDGRFGCPSLDSTVTAMSMNDRVLGESRMTGELPVRTIFCCTGNNLSFGADTARRVLLCRLETQEERPEDRTDFRHPDLLGFVRQHRHSLAVDALTILRGYVAAGKPSQGLTPFGSFEAWSNLVRAATVWAGLADPCDTRETVRQEDRSFDLLKMFIHGLEEIDTGNEGVTAADIVRVLGHPINEDASPDPYPTLRAAVAESCPKPTPQKIAAALRKVRNRISEGKKICFRKSHGGYTMYSVKLTGDCGYFGDSISHTQGENSEQEKETEEEKTEGEEKKRKGKEVRGRQIQSPESPQSPCQHPDHSDPSKWIHRGGIAFCPVCDLYKGRTQS